MAVIFKEIAKLHYQHVKVITNIKNHGTIRSVFVEQVEEKQESDRDCLIFYGYLKIIDPISKSTVLTYIEDHKVKENIIIVGRNIIEVTSSDKLDVIPTAEVSRIVELDTAKKIENLPFFKRDDAVDSLTSEDVLKRRESIVTWLGQNRIPCTFDTYTDEIIIAEKVRLKPPYEHISDYACPTRVILKRIKHIVDSRPALSNQVEDVVIMDSQTKVETTEQKV